MAVVNLNTSKNNKELEKAAEEASRPRVFIFEAIFRAHDETLGEEFSSRSSYTLPGFMSESDIKQRAWAWCDQLRDKLIDDIQQTPMHLAVLTVSTPNEGPDLSRDSLVLYRLF